VRRDPDAGLVDHTRTGRPHPDWIVVVAAAFRRVVVVVVVG
jgi:hypothetical protein